MASLNVRMSPTICSAFSFLFLSLSAGKADSDDEDFLRSRASAWLMTSNRSRMLPSAHRMGSISGFLVFASIGRKPMAGVSDAAAVGVEDLDVEEGREAYEGGEVAAECVFEFDTETSSEELLFMDGEELLLGEIEDQSFFMDWPSRGESDRPSSPSNGVCALASSPSSSSDPASSGALCTWTWGT